MNITRKYKIIAVAIVTVLTLGACTDEDKGGGEAQKETQAITEDYSAAAVEAVPYPLEEMKAGGWLERRNVRERLIRYADSSKISYIYLFSEQGQLIANYTLKGKVSNSSSQLTTSTQIIDGCGSGCWEAYGLDAPMDDGTWGPSEDAIFFFTTDGVMIQWNGPYVLADAPLNLTSTPVLVYNEGSEPTSVGDESLYGG